MFKMCILILGVKDSVDYFTVSKNHDDDDDDCNDSSDKNVHYRVR